MMMMIQSSSSAIDRPRFNVNLVISKLAPAIPKHNIHAGDHSRYLLVHMACDSLAIGRYLIWYCKNFSIMMMIQSSSSAIERPRFNVNLVSSRLAHAIPKHNVHDDSRYPLVQKVCDNLTMSRNFIWYCTRKHFSMYSHPFSSWSRRLWTGQK